MPAPRPLPIRILIRSNSLSHAMSEFPQRRSDVVFGRVLEESLLNDGYGVELRTHAVASNEVRDSIRTWEADVKAFAPDVVVNNLGYYECVHLFLPRWLERHANSLKARPGPIRSRYRSWLVKPAWMVLVKIQQHTDSVVGARFFKHKQKRFERQLGAYVARCLKVGEPLIVLFEFQVPGARGRSWFPGMQARAEMMNESLHRLVESFGRSNVVLLPVPALMEEKLPGIETNSDGFHYSSAGHAVVGEALADVVRKFVADQPRLQPRQSGADLGSTGS